MKSNLHAFLFCLIFLNTQKGVSQDGGGVQKQYIPNITVATPQVASMSKVGEIPIDISTGRMNYTIPIFEIKEGNFSMPINLSYNYSGLILDETPGYAGVGWAFNIGGSIMHSINGLDDEDHQNDKTSIAAYINKLPPFNTYTSKQTYDFLKGISNGLIDGEPDKYTVSVGSINCSFYLDKNNNPIFLKNENYQIIKNPTNGFTLIDDEGINYVFNLPINATKVQGTEESNYISSFLLTEINFPFSTNKIKFEYSDTVQYIDTNVSQTLIKATNQLGNPISTQDLVRNNIITTTFFNRNLNKITTSNCTIELDYNQNPSESGVSVVKKIDIKNNFENLVKNYSFSYSGWVGRRTNLLNIINNGQIINEMEYDMIVDYPVSANLNDRLKKDLWGYYNKNATAATSSTNPNDNPNIKPDFASTKIGALKKIIYQTKGYSIIDYEPNSIYIASGNVFPYDLDSTTYTNLPVKSNAATGGSSEKTFVVGIVPTEIEFDYTLANNTSIMPIDNREATVSIFSGLETNFIFRDSQPWSWENRWIPTNLNKIGTKQKIVINQLGTYHIKATSTIGASAVINARVKQVSDSFNQTVGGIRVQQVKNCDFNGECITNVYNYSQSGKSTGIMLQSPVFYSGYFIQDNSECVQGTYTKTDYFNYYSVFPLSNFKGSPVLYKIVEKIDVGEGSNNGKTIFSYLGKTTLNSLQDEQSYFITGLLDTKVETDRANTKITKQKNNYLFEKNDDTNKYVYSLESKHIIEKLSAGGTGIGSSCGPIYNSPLNWFKYGWRTIKANNYALQKEENTNYFHGDSLVQSTSYNYNLNTGFLKSQTTTSSGKETLETKYFYPTDAELVNEPFRNDLISKNIIGIPLSTQRYNGDKLSEQKTEYGNDASTSYLLVPKSVYTNKGVAEINKSADKKITYDKYDDKGNILQYTLESGRPVSIIWGYNKTLPIAKIENAAYDEIATYVANLQSLSNADDDNCMSSSCNEQILREKLNTLRLSLPQSMITTYTYNPLIGITSVTDSKGVCSYYEYDFANRLLLIKDKALNILQRYCYNYKGQQMDCSDLYPSIIYKSVARNGVFTRDNCGSGTGNQVSFSLEAGAVTSKISQADADAKGLDKFNTDGIAYANANGKCTFKSAPLTGSFQKSNCTVGGIGSFVTYSLAEGAVTLNTSQADVDQKAWTKWDSEGRINANAYGDCKFRSIAIPSQPFQKSDCTVGGVGSFVDYSLPEGAVILNTSQADVNAKAWTQWDSEGRANANATGKCTYTSEAISGSFTKNNCPVGDIGSPVNYTLPAGSFTSNISQDNANANATSIFYNNGQANANVNGTCKTTTYKAIITDSDPDLGIVWVTITASSADHPAKTLSVVISYDYPRNKMLTKTVPLVLPVNQAAKTFAISIPFQTYVKITSFY
jgi:hypothetical protein